MSCKNPIIILLFCFLLFGLLFTLSPFYFFTMVCFIYFSYNLLYDLFTNMT